MIFFSILRQYKCLCLILLLHLCYGSSASMYTLIITVCGSTLNVRIRSLMPTPALKELKQTSGD